MSSNSNNNANQGNQPAQGSNSAQGQRDHPRSPPPTYESQFPLNQSAPSSATSATDRPNILTAVCLCRPRALRRSRANRRSIGRRRPTANCRCTANRTSPARPTGDTRNPTSSTQTSESDISSNGSIYSPPSDSDEQTLAETSDHELTPAVQDLNARMDQGLNMGFQLSPPRLTGTPGRITLELSRRDDPPRSQVLHTRWRISQQSRHMDALAEAGGFHRQPSRPQLDLSRRDLRTEANRAMDDVLRGLQGTNQLISTTAEPHLDSSMRDLLSAAIRAMEEILGMLRGMDQLRSSILELIPERLERIRRGVGWLEEELERIRRELATRREGEERRAPLPPWWQFLGQTAQGVTQYRSTTTERILNRLPRCCNWRRTGCIHEQLWERWLRNRDGLFDF
jgi:hypothetical protein